MGNCVLAARKLLCYGYRHVCKMLNANKDELELELVYIVYALLMLIINHITQFICISQV
jgi:hypothetical protein